MRLAARQTWSFFEKFVTAEDNFLPPDNFQETPKGEVAHRTSPTNIGLYLNVVLAARDFGWIGILETVERLEATLATLQKLEHYRGHFLNCVRHEKDIAPQILDPPLCLDRRQAAILAGNFFWSRKARDWRNGMQRSQDAAEPARVLRRHLRYAGAGPKEELGDTARRKNDTSMDSACQLERLAQLAAKSLNECGRDAVRERRAAGPAGAAGRCALSDLPRARNLTVGAALQESLDALRC